MTTSEKSASRGGQQGGARRGEEDDPFVLLAERDARAQARFQDPSHDDKHDSSHNPSHNPSHNKESSVRKDEQKEAFRLTLTARAVARLQALRAQERDAELTLRVRIHAGGCSGYKTEFSLDKRCTALDMEVVQDGVRVLIDRLSAQTLGASSLDFESAPIGDSFRLLADKAHSACGCGVSFAL